VSGLPLSRHCRRRTDIDGPDNYASQFDAIRNAPTELLRELTRDISTIFRLVQNQIAMNGHTQSFSVVLAEDPVWDLSSNRAATLRKLLSELEMPGGRVQRMTGFVHWSSTALAHPILLCVSRPRLSGSSTNAVP